MNCLAHPPEHVEINKPKTKAEVERPYFSRQPVDKKRSRTGKNYK